MISVWNLLWIIPASFISGVFCLSLFLVNKINKVDDDVFNIEKPFENSHIDEPLQEKKHNEQK